MTVYDADEIDESRSPGLRHKHFSPTAAVVIVHAFAKVAANPGDAFIGLRKPSDAFRKVVVCENAEAYARALFEFFRECDRLGVERIFCEAVPEAGIGAAVMDRIRRAASPG
jgi:L-threonylcarbamoyladenylate synthase